MGRRFIGALTAAAGSCTILAGGPAVAAVPVVVFDGPVGIGELQRITVPSGVYHARLTASLPSTLRMFAHYEDWLLTLGPGGYTDGGDINHLTAGSATAFSATELIIDFTIPRSYLQNWSNGFVFTRDTMFPTLEYDMDGPEGAVYALTVTAELFPPGNVPESGTWALLILGFGVAGGVLRRRGGCAAAA